MANKPTTITYDGKVIASFSAGQTATLTTKGDEVEHNIVVAAGSGGGAPKLQEKTATENRVYLPEKGYDGFSKFTVDVKSGGSGEGISANVSIKAGTAKVASTQILIERPTINIEGTGEKTE